jgi:hypothetical protein
MGLVRSRQEGAAISSVENLCASAETTIALTAYHLPKECRPDLDALPWPTFKSFHMPPVSS